MRLLVSFLVWLVLCGGAMAQSLEDLIAKLPEGSYSDRAAVVAQIGASGDERGAAVLKALSDGELQARKDDGAVIRVTGKGTKAEAFDVLTGAALGPVAARSTEAVKVNNSLRRAIRSAISTLTLMSPDPARRMAAAERGIPTPTRAARRRSRRRLRRSRMPAVKAALEAARAASLLKSDAPLADRVAAVGVVAAQGGSDALAALMPLQSAEEPEIAEAAKRGASPKIERTRRCGRSCRTSGSGCRLGRCCCWRRSGSPSPSG